METNILLSKNFTLQEMLRSEKAEQLDIEAQYKPSAAVIANLKALCEHVLQPLREGLGSPLKITSGYRCPEVNKAIGGVTTSQHCYGEAADINNGSLEANKKIAEWLIAHADYDQIIIEGVSKGAIQWIHVSYSAKKNRKQVLIMRKVAGKSTYEKYTSKRLADLLKG